MNFLLPSLHDLNGNCFSWIVVSTYQSQDISCCEKFVVLRNDLLPRSPLFFMWVRTQSLRLLLFLQFSPTFGSRTGSTIGSKFRSCYFAVDIVANPITVLFCSDLEQFSIDTKNHSFIFHSIEKQSLHFAIHFVCFSSVNSTDYPQGIIHKDCPGVCIYWGSDTDSEEGPTLSEAEFE